MWSASTSALKTYGTYKASPVVCLLRSPNFMLCGYIWQLRLYRRQPLITSWCCRIRTTQRSLLQKSVLTSKQRHQEHHHFLSSSETLFDIGKGFVKQQELIALVHISVIAADDNTRQATGASPSISNVFQSHFDDASTSDIIVKAGEVKIHAHKIVLIAHSALFRAIFQSGTKEDKAEEVEMGQIEGPVLTALLSFMYGCLEDIPTDIALPLFVAADAHQVEMLRWTCLQCLLNEVDVETVREYAVVADAVTDKVLMDACMNFILTSKDSVKIAEQPAMQELMKNNTDLAQKMWVGVMKHMTSKRKADEICS
ncbi:TPA: hypothetical protein ACH3X2_007090 [Trebouxia sp. C0005]